MNVFLRELRANRNPLIIWSVGMFILVVSGMAKYTAYSEGGQANALFMSMPRSIKALLGFGSFDVTTISGFFAFLFIYIELAAVIHAALLGANIISKEERDKTAEFLMTKPVSRSAVIKSKLMAAILNIMVINIVTLISSIIIVAAYNKGADISGKIIMFMVSMFIVQMIFLSLGAALAACLKNPKSAESYVTGVLLLAFVVSKITDLTDRLNFLNLVSPFRYFDLNSLAEGKSLNSAFVLLSLVLTAAFLAVAFRYYQKRDLIV